MRSEHLPHETVILSGQPRQLHKPLVIVGQRAPLGVPAVQQEEEVSPYLRGIHLGDIL